MDKNMYTLMNDVEEAIDKTHASEEAIFFVIYILFRNCLCYGEESFEKDVSLLINKLKKKILESKSKE